MPIHFLDLGQGEIASPYPRLVGHNKQLITCLPQLSEAANCSREKRYLRWSR